MKLKKRSPHVMVEWCDVPVWMLLRFHFFFVTLCCIKNEEKRETKNGLMVI